MTYALIQARQNSKRFKNKIFEKLKNHYVLDWVIERTKKTQNVKDVIILIPDNDKNIFLKKYLIEKKIKYYAGSEENVLERFYLCIKKFKINNFVRICADNPIICPIQINNLINFFNENKCDYAYNHIPKENNFPDGIGGEISNLATIEKIYLNAKNKNQMEHMFNYLWDNKKSFKIKTFNHTNEKINFPKIKLDIDYKKDLLNLNKLNININSLTEDVIKEYNINLR